MLTQAEPQYMPLSRMLERVKKHHPGEGYKLVESAYLFAKKAHEGQFRMSGEPYFAHPASVAGILTDLMMDPQTIAAGLLHDTVEDCPDIDPAAIKQAFGEEVAALVDGVTKLDKLSFSDREEAQAESLRKMILAMSKDIRIVLIKLSDRLHNMRTLKYQPDDRRVAIARETLDIYAPLAHRLGVYMIKQQLEDLSLRCIDPKGYEDLVRQVGMEHADREENIRLVIKELSFKLDELRVHYDIDGRPKHFYSIYKKMVLQNKPFDQIYDLFAIRILVESVPDCYMVLGIVHTLWNQIPGRFKDYISVPKANMYRSLHTTVVGGRKIPFPFEVQIRTWEMHRIAEYGIAAHWRYKEGGPDVTDLDEKLYWLRQILDWQNETKDSREFIDSLKTDLFSEEVYVFTPKGDIISMQKGSTPIDFAYRIHSAIGNSCVGAKVNGKIVPLNTDLETGDRVDILTSAASKGPSVDWLKFCKTQQAKSKIKQFFKKEMRSENIEKGRDLLEREAKRHGVPLASLLKPEYYEGMLKKYGFTELDDILCAIGYGGMTSVYVAARLADEYKAREAPVVPKIPTPDELPKKPAKPVHGIFVEGEDGMLVRFARCCNPVPGDGIVGYITRGRGVTIHTVDCVNANSSETDRIASVSWAEENADKFDVSIQVVAYDHMSLLGELAMSISDMNIQIKTSRAKINQKNKTSVLTLVIQVVSRDQVDRVIKMLGRRSDVLDVYRGGS